LIDDGVTLCARLRVPMAISACQAVWKPMCVCRCTVGMRCKNA
jgi:hypothetical protein